MTDERAALAAPMTDAGKRLDSSWPGTHLDRLAWHKAILAIEAEARVLPPDPERLTAKAIEAIAYMGVIDIRQQVCAWCGMRYGYPHRKTCPITAQAPALRAAIIAEWEAVR